MNPTKGSAWNKKSDSINQKDSVKVIPNEILSYKASISSERDNRSSPVESENESKQGLQSIDIEVVPEKKTYECDDFTNNTINKVVPRSNAYEEVNMPKSDVTAKIFIDDSKFTDKEVVINKAECERTTGTNYHEQKCAEIHSQMVANNKIPKKEVGQAPEFAEPKVEKQDIIRNPKIKILAPLLYKSNSNRSIESSLNNKNEQGENKYPPLPEKKDSKPDASSATEKLGKNIQPIALESNTPSTITLKAQFPDMKGLANSSVEQFSTQQNPFIIDLENKLNSGNIRSNIDKDGCAYNERKSEGETAKVEAKRKLNMIRLDDHDQELSIDEKIPKTELFPKLPESLQNQIKEKKVLKSYPENILDVKSISEGKFVKELSNSNESLVRKTNIGKSHNKFGSKTSNASGLSSDNPSQNCLNNSHETIDKKPREVLSKIVIPGSHNTVSKYPESPMSTILGAKSKSSTNFDSPIHGMHSPKSKSFANLDSPMSAVLSPTFLSSAKTIKSARATAKDKRETLDFSKNAPTLETLFKLESSESVIGNEKDTRSNPTLSSILDTIESSSTKGQGAINSKSPPTPVSFLSPSIHSEEGRRNSPSESQVSKQLELTSGFANEVVAFRKIGAYELRSVEAPTNFVRLLCIPLNGLFNMFAIDISNSCRFGRNNSTEHGNFVAFPSLVVSRNHTDIVTIDEQVLIF